MSKKKNDEEAKAFTDKETGKRFVYQMKNGVLVNKVVEGETPNGWYDLIREAKMASTAPALDNDGDDGDDSPAAAWKGAELKEKIAALNDRETLEKIVSLDSRTGARNAATARLAELSEE
jgi:hypothetical protein